MKLRDTTTLVLLLLLVVSLVGCSSTAATDPEQNDTQPQSKQTAIAIPAEEPALTGMVKELTGNEVTIIKMALPAGRPDAPPPAQAEDEAQTPPDPNALSEPSAQTPDLPAAESDDPDASVGTKGEQAPPVQETETFIIPAGAAIVSGNGESTTAIALTDISENQMIRVWKTNDTISLVQVIGGQGERQRNLEEDANGQMPPGGGPGGMPGGGGPGGISSSLGGSR